MIPSYPKIFAIGTDYIKDIFEEPVEISEKIDGSLLAYGKINGKLHARSKGKHLILEHPESLFAEGVDHIRSIEHKLPNNIIFYCEYLKKPKHNTLKYNRIPKNHMMLFGVMGITQSFTPNLEFYLDILEIEPVPVFHTGEIKDLDTLKAFMERESVLGGPKMEGLVAKNYFRQFLLGGQPMPLMAGKMVSESFKEVHRERWGKEEVTKSRLEVFMESFRTEARWEKSIQHLRESGEIENEPRDIGKLIKEIQRDIEEEEKEAVKEFLWKEFKAELLRKSIKGFPEWYKDMLAERSFEEAEK